MGWGVLVCDGPHAVLLRRLLGGLARTRGRGGVPWARVQRGRRCALVRPAEARFAAELVLRRVRLRRGEKVRGAIALVAHLVDVGGKADGLARRNHGLQLHLVQRGRLPARRVRQHGLRHLPFELDLLKGREHHRRRRAHAHLERGEVAPQRLRGARRQRHEVDVRGHHVLGLTAAQRSVTQHIIREAVGR